LLEAAHRLTPGFHGGSPSPFDICDTCVHFLCFFKPLHLTLSKYLLNLFSDIYY
jgi:hypothetical protein